MKPLHRILVTALLALGAFSTMLYTSCKDKCGSTTCQNGGTCSDNVCICPTGYSGTSCENAWTSLAIGTYNCSRGGCSPAVAGPNAWVSAVTTDPTYGGYTIDIANFDNSNTTIAATIDSANNITIVPAAGTYGINARGSYVNGKITLQFTTYTNGSVGYRCTMTMIKE